MTRKMKGGYYPKKLLPACMPACCPVCPTESMMRYCRTIARLPVRVKTYPSLKSVRKSKKTGCWHPCRRCRGVRYFNTSSFHFRRLRDKKQREKQNMVFVIKSVIIMVISFVMKRKRPWKRLRLKMNCCLVARRKFVPHNPQGLPRTWGTLY